MDTNLDEGRLELGRIARQLFEARSPISAVRALEDDPRGYDPDLWREMAGLDWLGLSYPSSLGGSGGSVLDLLPIYHEMGRALLPSPHLASAVIAGEVLATDPTRAELVRSMASGATIVVPALYEPDTSFGPQAVTLEATPAGSGFRLSGTKVLVPFAGSAASFVVVARTGPGPEGITLFLCEADRAGVSIEPTPNIAGAALAVVTFDGVEVPAGAVIGAVGGGWAALRPVLDRATVLRCAEITGAGERLLELSVDYALKRQQFGQPIGKFQAVQYLCTDIAIATHVTSLLTRHAAWRIDSGMSAEREVALAKAYGSRAAQTVAHRAHEVHAGVAFMLETDVQLYTRRAKHWELDLGDADFHDEQIVAALVG